MKQVNQSLILLYWDIGKSIVEKQQEYGWGKSIVETLSKDLQKEFPGVQGWSSRNLWYMRNFFNQYKDNSKLQPMVAEISWSHNLVIMDKCKEATEPEFYMLMSKKYGWTKNVLIHNIEGKSYERYLLGQTNFDKALPEKDRYRSKLAVKDDYHFDFWRSGRSIKRKNWNWP